MEFTGDNVNHSTSYYEQNVRKASQVFRVLIIKFCYFSIMSIDIYSVMTMKEPKFVGSESG